MTEDSEHEDERRPQSAPETITFTVRGAIDPTRAEPLVNVVAGYVRELSRFIDLSDLDGITIAEDYDQALLDLDRGYETNHKLTATKGEAVGVAMTPAVIRNGKIKSHMILQHTTAWMLEDHKHELFGLGLHTIAHECAHVEITSRFDSAFPNTLLQKRHGDAKEDFRWQIIKACWDEYAACWISAPFGTEPTNGYEANFINFLNTTRREANESIKAYRLHGNVLDVMAEVYRAYGNLMKFACYHLGNMVGRGLTLDQLPASREALEDHWFATYFERLGEACSAIREDYGDWKDTTKFEAIGDLLDEIVVEGGVIARPVGGGELYVAVPFTPDTMPV